MINPQRVQKVLELISKRPANHDYFFSKLTSPDWIEPLERAGLFSAPPNAQREEKGVSFPFWPESRYLVRMASKVPNIVIKTILNVDTDNIRIHDDFIEAALNMPPELAIQIVPSAKRWLQSPYQLLFPEKLGQLAAYLAEGNQIEAALDLVSALLEPISEKETNAFSKVTARFNKWHYEQIIEKNIPIIINYGQEKALQLLCNLLVDAIMIAKPDSEDGEDGSDYWQEGYIKLYKDDIRSLLAVAIRDSAESLIEIKGKQVLDIIEEKPFNIFKRIGLFLRCKWPDIDPEKTTTLVVNPEIISNISLYHELLLLIQVRYNSFPKEIQDKYLEMVENEEQKYYQYRRLWPIQDFLNTKWKKKFEDLKKEFGNQNPNVIRSYDVTWVGPTSPKTLDELLNMKIEELISYLSCWEPSNDLRSPSPDGLGRVLTSLVELESDKFCQNAEKFKELDPTYVRSLIDGLEAAIKNGKPISWDPIINLCSWVLEQPIEIPGRKSRYFDLDPDWSWARKSIADLLEKALNGDTSGLTYNYRQQVWTIILPLTDDPNPSSDENEEKTNMDPATMSINSTRGRALHAVISYALWVRRYYEKQPNKEMLIKRGFDEMPEVREVLDKHLDYEQEKSLGVHAVYGWYFPWLDLLDKKWTKSNISKIFPRQEDLLKYRNAAWGTYIGFCQPYDSVVELLRDEYLFETERLSSFTEGELASFNYQERIAGHFITMYWLEKISMDELLYFFKKAKDETCAEAIQYAGENLNKISLDELPMEKLKMLQHFWETRINIIKGTSQQHPKELAAFGWWFMSRKFEDGWSIIKLKEVLLLIGNIEPDDMIVNIFENMISKLPIDILECLNMMVKGDAEGWRVSLWKNRLKNIINKALDIPREEVREKVIAFINILGARGFIEFRDLLPK